MFAILFFIPSFVFILLAIIFYLCISNVEKLDKAFVLSIGKLNIDDIRKLDNSKRNYLKNQVLLYFSMAFIVTLVISALFIIIGNTDSGLLALPCDLIGTIVGLWISLRVLKKANILKKEML